MLICERAQIAFVQIPKNGSKSVMAALSASFGLDHSHIAADVGWTAEQYAANYKVGIPSYHPALGDNNPDHLPLRVHREHLPQSYAAFCRAKSFAFVRQPRERFLSAVMQRLGEFHDQKNVRVDDPIVREEARAVCDWLEAHASYDNRNFAHFMRQIDYVDVDGERKVDAIFPIHRTDAAELWVQQQTGVRIHIPRIHVRREPTVLGKLVTPAFSMLGRSLVPEGLRRAIYPLYRNSKLFQSAADRYGEVRLDDEVEAFIASYYAPDYALYEEALRQTDRAVKPLVA